MITSTKFPVPYATKVPVKCAERYTKTDGDDNVKCDGKTDYIYTTLPICEPGDILLQNCVLFI